MKNRTEKRTDDNNIELETPLQELMLYLLSDGVETDIRRRTNLFNCRGHGSSKDKRMNGGQALEMNEKQRSG
jgi:hypothetical protein